ncbi:MAG: DinB family protein [Fimbriimonadaceae bacterium]
MPSPYALHYLFQGLEAAPIVQTALCQRIADWDARPPGEDRFTVRESLAHLADWEPIWLERMRRTVIEDYPSLPDMDEGAMAIERNYAASDPSESLRRYREGRADLVAFLRGLTEEDWGRKCHREGQGDVLLFELAALVLGHDGYHFRHTLDSLDR